MYLILIEYTLVAKGVMLESPKCILNVDVVDLPQS